VATANTVTNVTDALRQLPYLAILDDGALRRLARACAWRTAEKDGQLFREGDTASGVFVIVEGRVKVIRLSSSGREQVLHAEGPGASLGEVPVFDGGGYLATAVAMTRVRVLFVARRALMDVGKRHPEVAMGIAMVLARRLRSFSALIGTLTLRTVSAGVAAILLETSQALGLPIVDIGSRDDLAARLGTVREIVSRSLTQLVTAGAVTRVGRRVKIVDAARLRAIAER
jgi:CRP/FNR family transcriptional regulator